jgi:hypothetical protein
MVPNFLAVSLMFHQCYSSSSILALQPHEQR